MTSSLEIMQILFGVPTNVYEEIAIYIGAITIGILVVLGLIRVMLTLAGMTR